MAATKVGVGEDEYITMCTELKSMQDNFLQQIENVKEKIATINCMDGGFYSEQISPNVNKIIATLEQIESSIEQVQSVENEMIHSFSQTIDNVDSCC